MCVYKKHTIGAIAYTVGIWCACAPDGDALGGVVLAASWGALGPHWTPLGVLLGFCLNWFGSIQLAPHIDSVGRVDEHVRCWARWR